MEKRLSTGKQHHEESSESENETEPAKLFHRRLSTNAKSSVSIGTSCYVKLDSSFLHDKRTNFRIQRCLNTENEKLIKFQFDPVRSLSNT